VWVSALQGGVNAPGQARHEIAERLNGQLPAARRQDVVLLAGELVANVVSVAVTDEGSLSVPTVRPRSATLEAGRGLFLVEQLSDRWGVTRDGTRRTRVWFEMVRERREPT
jgi:hypothetical protein